MNLPPDDERVDAAVRVLLAYVATRPAMQLRARRLMACYTQGVWAALHPTATGGTVHDRVRPHRLDLLRGLQRLVSGE